MRRAARATARRTAHAAESRGSAVEGLRPVGRRRLRSLGRSPVRRCDARRVSAAPSIIAHRRGWRAVGDAAPARGSVAHRRLHRVMREMNGAWAGCARSAHDAFGHDGAPR
jgi:hypothetical protein